MYRKTVASSPLPSSRQLFDDCPPLTLERIAAASTEALHRLAAASNSGPMLAVERPVHSVTIVQLPESENRSTRSKQASSRAADGKKLDAQGSSPERGSRNDFVPGERSPSSAKSQSTKHIHSIPTEGKNSGVSPNKKLRASAEIPRTRSDVVNVTTPEAAKEKLERYAKTLEMEIAASETRQAEVCQVLLSTAIRASSLQVHAEEVEHRSELRDEEWSSRQELLSGFLRKSLVEIAILNHRVRSFPEENLKHRVDVNPVAAVTAQAYVLNDLRQILDSQHVQQRQAILNSESSTRTLVETHATTIHMALAKTQEQLSRIVLPLEHELKQATGRFQEETRILAGDAQQRQDDNLKQLSQLTLRVTELVGITRVVEEHTRELLNVTASSRQVLFDDLSRREAADEARWKSLVKDFESHLRDASNKQMTLMSRGFESQTAALGVDVRSALEHAVNQGLGDMKRDASADSEVLKEQLVTTRETFDRSLRQMVDQHTAAIQKAKDEQLSFTKTSSENIIAALESRAAATCDAAPSGEIAVIRQLIDGLAQHQQTSSSQLNDQNHLLREVSASVHSLKHDLIEAVQQELKAIHNEVPSTSPIGQVTLSRPEPEPDRRQILLVQHAFQWMQSILQCSFDTMLQKSAWDSDAIKRFWREDSRHKAASSQPIAVKANAYRDAAHPFIPPNALKGCPRVPLRSLQELKMLSGILPSTDNAAIVAEAALTQDFSAVTESEPHHPQSTVTRSPAKRDEVLPADLNEAQESTITVHPLPDTNQSGSETAQEASAEPSIAAVENEFITTPHEAQKTANGNKSNEPADAIVTTELPTSPPVAVQMPNAQVMAADNDGSSSDLVSSGGSEAVPFVPLFSAARSIRSRQSNDEVDELSLDSLEATDLESVEGTPISAAPHHGVPPASPKPKELSVQLSVHKKSAALSSFDLDEEVVDVPDPVPTSKAHDVKRSEELTLTAPSQKVHNVPGSDQLASLRPGGDRSKKKLPLW